MQRTLDQHCPWGMPPTTIEPDERRSLARVKRLARIEELRRRLHEHQQHAARQINTLILANERGNR